ncbi:MAG: YceI family protein [Pseudomonadota bacterium]
MKRTGTALKHNALAAAILAGGMATSGTAVAEPQEYTIDDEHFTMTFKVMHIGYARVIGMFREVEGQFVYDPEKQTVSDGEVVFQADSVFTNHEERDEHLRGEDFLNVSEYPEIRFEVTGFEMTGESTGKLTGDLSMLGETNPVTLDVVLNKAAEYPIGHGDYTLGLSAHAEIERSDWGMTYGIADDLVGDEVRLQFEFEANRDDGGWF